VRSRSGNSESCCYKTKSESMLNDFVPVVIAVNHDDGASEWVACG
jgi:hypothetical protein